MGESDGFEVVYEAGVMHVVKVRAKRYVIVTCDFPQAQWYTDLRKGGQTCFSGLGDSAFRACVREADSWGVIYRSEREAVAYVNEVQEACSLGKGNAEEFAL